MFSLYRTLSLRYLRRRRVRTLLVIASIALGVAMLVATQALNRCIARAGSGTVNPLVGQAALQVTNDDAGVRRDVLDKLRASPVPGVRQFSPIVLGRGALPERGNRQVSLVGVDLSVTQAVDSPWPIDLKDEVSGLAWTRALAENALGTPMVYVGKKLADDLSGGLVKIKLQVSGAHHTINKVGRVEGRGAASLLNSDFIFLELSQAATLLGQPDFVTRIDVLLHADANREEVRDRLARLVSGHAQVRFVEAGEAAFRDVLAGMEVGFKLGGFIALVVGLFLVYNALSVTVAERRRDIGTMRSLGATRWQIWRLFVTEAMILGLAGAAIGVPLGWGLATLFLGPFIDAITDVFLPLSEQPVELTWDLVLAAVGAGVLTSCLAALLPAAEAAAEEPADAVRRAPRAHNPIYGLLQLAGTATFLGTGLLAMFGREHLPKRMGTYGGVLLVLVGVLISAPLITQVAARGLRPLFRRLLGLEGRMAADNLARSPGRTGLVIAAVAAVVALVLMTAGLILSSESAILQWVEDSITGDLFVTSGSPLSSSGKSLSMGEPLGKQLETLPGVEAALPVRFKKINFRDKLVYLNALEAVAFHRMDQERAAAPGTELYPELTQPNTVLISENFSALHGVHPGDTITLQGALGPADFRVLGTVVDYSWNRGTILIDRTQFRKIFNDHLIDVFYVYLKHGAPAAEAQELQKTIQERWGAEFGLMAQTREHLRLDIRRMILRLYGIAYAQEFVIALVAALGLVTALLISVMQRTRELGLFRAVGATQSQVLRSVLAEAGLMCFIGVLIGVGLGLPLEWFVVRVVLLEDAGFAFPVRVPWLSTGLVLGAAMLIGFVAGLGPAWHATRLRIAEAIAYE